MKSNQLAKARVAQAEQESPETPRPIWFLGKELKDEPQEQDKPEADKADEPAAKAAKPKKTERKAAQSKAAAEEVPEPAMAPEERRPTQLEAYMRYAKMREPREDEALAPVGTRRFPSGHQDAANEDDMEWAGKAPRRRPQRRPASGLRARDAVLAGIASIAIGTLAGAIVYDRTNDGALSTVAFDSIGGFLTGLNAPPNNAMANAGTSVAAQSASASFKKPVTTARLDVADAKGNVNSLIPLSISAEPALPDQDIALRLSGLPADAYLTAGTKLANNAWILKPGEELGVKLMVPSAQASPLLIAVEAIEAQTGDLAAPTEEINVALSNTTATPPPPPQQVEPASAPPTDVKRNFNLPPASQHESAAAQPIPAPLESAKETSTADSASLMRNGDKLLGVGDFTAARAFFSKARDLGNREASLRLGQTYDPVIFRERNVQGLKPDPAMALKYYLEARTAGIEDANTAITGLETWMKQ